MEKIQVKKCNKCNVIKPILDYEISKEGWSRGSCMACNRIRTDNWFKGKSGLISRIYSNQKHSCVQRSMPMPTYTRNWLYEWALSQDIFHKLHEEWAESGYDKYKSPSVDRIDDYMSYTETNIQWMTCRENLDKNYRDVRNGVNTKGVRSVIQLSLNGDYIDQFYSMAEASRRTGVPRKSIGHCCSGRNKTSNGFIWRYKDQNQVTVR